MSAPTSPDPDPATTPGLEAGGGVAPGDTPPGESSTSGAADRQPRTGSRGANWAAYVIIGLVVGFALLFFVGYAIGLAD
ncbi:DUF6480 family protein [Cellulomonas phragmiteti]|uniref:Uncharacterized protein n=1 Tax=Cellulomonas phragmiteti TaxID=478780 RepID=A0ABQ4DMF3_9CELL|nr:DUF6480 family protein [Cellulomonas phragmiteti]GIG40177.1 hypothetical protein Cph01nite_19390 [Cellulomonas phragmiteti]